MKKKTVRIELCDLHRVYEGRLLGLIDDREFTAILGKGRYQNKLFSCQTVPLFIIAKNYPNLAGMRLALAVKKINGESIPGKHLFVTEKLNFVASQEEKEVGIRGYKDEYYILTEEDSVS